MNRDRKRVTKSTSDEQVLVWVSQGVELDFDSSLDSFKELSDNVRRELNRENLDRYWVSYHHWKDLEKRKDMPEPSGIRVEPVASSADLRMKVDFKDPGFHDKWTECWIRPDEVRERSYRGYVPVQSDEVEVFCSTPAGPPAITDGQGKVEMLLYKVPNEIRAEARRKQKEQSLGRLDRERQTAKEAVNRVAGDQVFFDPESPEKRGTVKWHEEPSSGSLDTED